MLANTPKSSNKRLISEGSTPSPSIKKSSKNAKLDKLENNQDKDMESANKQLSDSIMETVKLAKLKDEEKWQYLVKHLNLLSKKVHELQVENGKLKASMATANGKIAFLENQVEKAKEKIGNIEWKSLQGDIVLYNLPETPGKSDEETLIGFLINKLKIHNNAIRTPENITGPIHVDSIFRVGKKFSNRPRALIVTFALKNSKKIVMEHYRQVQKTSQVKITDHFSSEMRERRSVQKDALKNTKISLETQTSKLNWSETSSW